MPRVTRNNKDVISSSDDEISNDGSSSLIDSSNESTQSGSITSEASGVSFYVIKIYN